MQVIAASAKGIKMKELKCLNCTREFELDAKFCTQCGISLELIDVTCNMCGLTCRIGPDSQDRELSDLSGLINQTVVGCYNSTAGNGYGALDDCIRYTFSLCEYCLDWLFSKFCNPVKISDMSGGSLLEQWKPAVKRVEEDEWRKFKKEFMLEHTKRFGARIK